MNIQKIVFCLSIISINYTYTMEKLDKLILKAYIKEKNDQSILFNDNGKKDTATATVYCAQTNRDPKRIKILAELEKTYKPFPDEYYRNDQTQLTKKTTCYRCSFLSGPGFMFKTSYNQEDLTQLINK